MENIINKIYSYLKGNADKTPREISYDLDLPTVRVLAALDMMLLGGSVVTVENPNSGEFYYHIRQE